MPDSSARQAGFADIHGARLYYEVAGAGPALLLLHAGVADSRMWDDQFDEFAQHYRVIRYDLRGFGQTAVPHGLFAHHEDAAALLKFLGVARAYVVGISFGGYIALDFALAHPMMVQALALGAPGVSGQIPSEAIRRFNAEEEALLAIGDIDAAIELNLRTWVDGPNRTPDQVAASVRERVRKMQRRAFMIPVPADAEEYPLTPPAIMRLDEILAPTLILVGDQDLPDLIALANRLEVQIANARKVIMPGVAHLLNLERPVEFNRIVLDFFRAQ